MCYHLDVNSGVCRTLELEAVVSFPAWLLGSELWSHNSRCTCCRWPRPFSSVCFKTTVSLRNYEISWAHLKLRDLSKRYPTTPGFYYFSVRDRKTYCLTQQIVIHCKKEFHCFKNQILLFLTHIFRHCMGFAGGLVGYFFQRVLSISLVLLFCI